MRTMQLSLALAMLFAAAAWSQDAATDRKLLEGKWAPSAAEVGGNPLPKEVLQTILLEVAGEKYTVTVGKTVDKGTVKIDAAAKPKTMDIVGTEGPNKGKTILAIYEVKDDTLRVCYDLSGKARPTEFKTKKGELVYLATYQRQKP